MAATPRDVNPFPYSDSNKRYYTYDYYLRKKFGVKAVKIPLDAGFSCPHIKKDGFGCTFCSPRGSGDTVPDLPSLREQYDAGRRALSSKWDTSVTLAYLQAHTNTFAPRPVLERVYDEVLAFPGVRGLNIATRADCLPPDVLDLLAEVSEKTSLTVELGLQSSNDVTAGRIHRGHAFAGFLRGFGALREHVPKAEICVHLIFGLPGEDEGMMMKTVSDVASLAPDQVKIHLLHVLEGTLLADEWRRGGYVPITKEEYVSAVCTALTLLPPRTVIARLTGDGLPGSLLAPLWSRKKVSVINDIDKKLYSEGLYQGCRFTG